MVFENGNKLIYTVVLREIYGILVASLLPYKKVFSNLESIGSESNLHDPCVANRIKLGKQHTVIFHVENIISNNVIPKFNDKFKEWMNCNYGKHGEVKSNSWKVNNYPGMIFNFIEKGKVKTKMDDNAERMIKEFQWK